VLPPRLTGREALRDLPADRLFGDTGNEIPGHLEVDIRLEKGHAHLAHRLLDVVFSQGAVAAELSKDTLEPVCQVFKHSCCFCSVSKRKDEQYT